MKLKYTSAEQQDVRNLLPGREGEPFANSMRADKSHQMVKKNCTNEYVIGYSDANCNELCSGDTAKYNNFILKDGVCVEKKIAANIDECELSKGFITMYAYNEMFNAVEYFCSSIDPGITGRDKNSTNELCLNGSLEGGIDYRKGVPSLLSCKCSEKTQLLMITNNSFNVRANGICVPLVFKRILSDLNLGIENIIF